MSDDNIPHQKLTGRTYGRPRVCQASRAFDEVVSSEIASATVKECGSSWAKSSSFSECEDCGIASVPKKGRIDMSENDSFSFDNDERKAKPMKMWHQLQEQRYRTENSEMVTMLSQSTCSPHKLGIAASFCESGMKASPEKSACLSKSRRAATRVNGEASDDLSLHLKPYTFKTDSKEVILNEKPNLPLRKKYRRGRQQKARGRRHLTVCERTHIEDYRTNSTSKLLTEKLNPSWHESDESAVLSKHELASKNQGTNVPLYKHTSQLVKVGRQAKYFLKNSKYKVNFNEAMAGTSQEDLSTDGSNDVSSTTSITEVASRTGTQSQNVLFMEDNSSQRTSTQEVVSTSGSNNSAFSSTVISEDIPAEIGTQPQNVLLMGDNSSQPLSPPTSNSSYHLSPTSLTCKTKTDNYSISRVESSLLSQTSLSGDDNCLLNMSQRSVRKQHRLFKSRPAQIEEKLKPSVFTWPEHDDSSLPNRKLVKNASGDSQTTTPARGKLLTSPASSVSSQASNSAEPTAAVKCKLKTISYQHIDFSSARELPKAQLHHHIEQDTDAESMSVLGSVSESPEPSSSQETSSNSQKSLGGESLKSSSPALNVWKFFKSKKSLSQPLDLQKRMLASSPQKLSAKASYNIRSWNTDHDTDLEEKTAASLKKNDETDVVVLQKSEDGPKLKREMHWPVRIHDEAYTTLTVSRSHKELYTVIQNVRQTHEVQELGETHDFIKEVDYLLESLKETNSTTIRCLSCLKLASKCISPAFRMHMRVHGTVCRIFNLLQDACSDPSLALSTSAVMFMLSRDRLSMDLDHHILSLMLKLNENDASDVASLGASSMQGLEKTRQKVKELLGLLQGTYSREVDLDFVSTSSLALESLLSLTSRRAGEWFTEELRSVGGLGHIVDSVRFCEMNLPEDLSKNIQKSLPVLRKLNRCLRVLENISYMNSENQSYLLSYRNSVLLQSCSRTLRLCQLSMPAFKLPENLDSKEVKGLPGHTILTCLLSVLRVMINITHGQRLTSLGEMSLLETVVQCLTVTMWSIPVEQRFDLAVQCLVLLTNLVEHQEENCHIFMHMRTQVKYAQKPLARSRTVSAIRAVVELFVQREQAAREMEEEIESMSDTSASPLPKLSGRQQETVTNVQQATRKQRRVKKRQKKHKTLAGGIPRGASNRELQGNQSGEHQGNPSILEDGEETFTKALHKAGKHMENSIVAAYAAILLGSLMADNKEHTSVVKKLLPNGDFRPMVIVLTKFLRFMVLVTAHDHADVKLIERVIEVLKSA